MDTVEEGDDIGDREDVELPLTTSQKWIAGWGVFGVSLFLLRALVNLTPLALEPLQTQTLNAWQGVVYVVWVLFNAYAEGYRGFHKGFSPRVVRRACELAREPDLVDILLAPAVSMGLLRAPRRRKIVAWSLVGGIVAVVIWVRSLAQPWRGIIDGGVVVGLAIGVASLYFHFVRALWTGAAPPLRASRETSHAE